MIRTDFDALVDRYLHGQLIPEEKNKFEAWLDVKKASRETGMVLTGEDEQRLFETIVSKTTSVADISTFCPKSHTIKTSLSNGVLRIVRRILYSSKAGRA